MSWQAVRNLAALTLSFLAISPAVATAEDWPQWMGPARDGRWTESGILEKFPEGGPKLLWKAPISGGYSGPAVADGRVYVTDYVKKAGDAANNPGKRAELVGQERVLCFDARTGEQLWKHEYECLYSLSYPCGPRATPTVAGGKVYTLGSEGNLFCLDAKTGKVAWQKDLKVAYKAPTPIWGFCSHPLVDGNKLICIVGGEGSVAVAFDKDTGNELWKNLSATEPGYSAPAIIEAGGVRQLLIWHAQSVNSLNPENGNVYWTQPLQPDFGMAIMAPQKSGDYLFASGIGYVGALFKLDSTKPAAEVAWRGTRQDGVYCSNSTAMIEDGVIYGADCEKGSLRAVQLSDGKRLWDTWEPTTGTRRARHGTVFIVKQEKRYFLFSENGDLIIAKLTPEKYEEVGRANLLAPTGEAFGREVVWTYPAFANKCVFVRNDKELVCYSLAAE